MDFYDDSGFEPEPEERERDPKVDEAKKVILEFFVQHPDGVFYERQVQVRFEKTFFHWITADALHELRDEVKFLRSCESDGMKLENCPAYVREWMDRVED
jgi:hypothetical protein